MSDPTLPPGTDRIENLDVLRGLALLGILLVNAAAFAFPPDVSVSIAAPPFAPATLPDWFAAWGVHVLAEGKFVSLFSMLFGISLFLVGGGSPDDPAARAAGGRRLLSRLFWLGLFGIAHGALLWFGDILLSYAVAGLLVLPVRHWRGRHLGIAGAVLISLGLMLYGLPAWLLGQVDPGLAQQVFAGPVPEDLKAQAEAMRGSMGAAAAQGFDFWVERGLGSVLFFAPLTAGLMMVGLGLFKSGFFHGHWQTRSYLAVIGPGAVALVLITAQTLANAAAGYDAVYMMTGGFVPNLALAPLVTLAYAAAIILGLRAGRLGLMRQWLEPVGRLALTNYIGQTLIMTTLFLGWRGLGLYGQVDRAALLGICVAVWVVQVLFSRWYRARYEQGPLEWAWRCLTDYRRYPFGRRLG